MKRFNVLTKLFCSVTYICIYLLAITGCTYEQLEVPFPEIKEGVMIEMNIRGFDIPVTRSIEDGKGEAVVKDLDVLVFDKSSPAKLLEHIKGDNITQTPSGTTYKVGFNAKVSVNPDARTVVVIANASDEVDSVIALNQPGTEKQEILSALTFATQQQEGSYKWDVSAAYTPIPMYGEAAVTGLSTGQQITGINLIRMLSRIDVQNKVNGSTFKLEEIYVVNYNTAGYIAPAWNTANGVILKTEDAGYPYSSSANPMIPTPSGKQPNTESASMKYEYTQDNGAGALLAGEIYTYEALKATGEASNDPTNAPCLVIKGKYDGEDYYYRVDFTTEVELNPGGEKSIQYMPLYRNYKYIVTITAAEGTGYTTFDEAVKSISVLSNLKTEILWVDMNDIREIVYDGQYYMGMDDSKIDVIWNVESTVKKLIRTDYEGSWKAEIVNPTQHTWLRFPGNKTVIDGVDIDNTELEIKVTPLTSPIWNGNNYGEGKISLTVGRLKMELTVRRVSVASLFARSNVVLRGTPGFERLTFAVSEGDNTMIPAYSQGVLFKWGSLIALSPAENPYDPQIHVIYNPTSNFSGSWGTELAGWDKIPYAYHTFGFPSSAAGEEKDAFDGFNTYGFNTTSGVGDICRYISSEEGGKDKWVEGNWRMPTYKEIKMLYDESPMHALSAGDFKNTTSILNASPGMDEHAGKFNPGSGWFLGPTINSSTPTPGNMAVPPEGTVFLPTGGFRYPNGDGDVVQVGSYGYYWTSSPYDGVTVNYPFMSKDGFEEYDADRSYAFPIRCIRDY